MKKKTYIYRGFERFWHWNQAFLIFFLALTGFEVHGAYEIFGFENAVTWHNIAAWSFLILIVFTIFWHFVTGEWRQYIPTTKFLKAQFEYYISGIFKGAPHPTHKTIYNKFNPLQRLVYLGLKLLLLPVMVLSGLIYMFYVFPGLPLETIRLAPIALVHTLGAFGLLAFVIAHVYLTTTGEKPLTSIKAMITGWEAIEVDPEEMRMKHLAEAVNDSAAGYYRINRDGIVVDVNNTWLKMYKCPGCEKIIGQHYSRTQCKEDLPKMDNMVKRALQGVSFSGIPLTRKCMDNSTAYHLLSMSPVREDGLITGIEGFILELNESLPFPEHLGHVVRDSSAGYYRIDKQGILLEVNEAWLSLYKYNNSEEVKGRHYSITRAPEEMAKLDDIFQKVMHGESISSSFAKRICRDGSEGRHILSANPVYEGNIIVGMEGFILDIPDLSF